MDSEKLLHSMLEKESRRIVKSNAPFILDATAKFETHITIAEKGVLIGRSVVSFKPEGIFGLTLSGHVFSLFHRPIEIAVTEVHGFILPYMAQSGKLVADINHPFLSQDIGLIAQTALVAAGAAFALTRLGVKPKDAETVAGTLNILIAYKLNG